jgi:hypothetical protein
MKLQELAVANPTKQAAKVFESYFGTSIRFDTISRRQAQGLLNRVRSLISEHRRTPEFHRSERNPAYLKLVMLEQALATQAATPVAGTQQVNPQQQAGLMAAQQQEKKRQIQDAIKAKQAEIADLQKQMNNPVMSTMESRRSRRLREASEIQQAQVVLASQDMVDQVQKMSEQVSSMQFKDLPALVDQIKNEVGVDQATQFNGDASAALSGLLQNLQGAKQQLEAALGVVTGQAPQVPGADMSAPDMGAEPAELPAELPAPGEEDIDAEMDANVEPAGLGRERR